MNTVASEWEGYVEAVMPKDAPPIQRKEMRRSFYAGAAAILAIQSDISSDQVSEAAGVAILQGLHEEMRDFLVQMKNGSA